MAGERVLSLQEFKERAEQCSQNGGEGVQELYDDLKRTPEPDVRGKKLEVLTGPRRP